jgi:murein DD-endopeptidase MepM/ murein hydrolase activator NlpD
MKQQRINEGVVKINRTKLIQRALGAAAATALMLAGLVGTAQAQTSTANYAATFAGQARAGGLTTAQANGLQAEVNSYLAQLGGKQIAANAIDLDGTGIAVVPVPGELKVRNLAGSAAVSPEATGTCFVGDFCAWQLFNQNGGFLAKFKCNSAVNFPRSNPDWLAKTNGVFQGSYWNHQTGGAHAFIYGGVNGTGKLDISPPAGAPVTAWAWGVTPIDRSFVACH